MMMMIEGYIDVREVWKRELSNGSSRRFEVNCRQSAIPVNDRNPIRKRTNSLLSHFACHGRNLLDISILLVDKIQIVNSRLVNIEVVESA